MISYDSDDDERSDDRYDVHLGMEEGGRNEVWVLEVGMKNLTIYNNLLKDKHSNRYMGPGRLLINAARRYVL